MAHEYAAVQVPSISVRHVRHDDDTGLATLAAEAVAIFDDVRRALERNFESARATVRPNLLTATGTAPARGGLAPWQKLKIERILRERLDQSIRTEELAKVVSLSVGYFCRAFRESFGDTPHAHVMKLRVNQAQRLMLTTDEPLSQIAQICGFCDQAHLSKFFRRCVGQSPGVWRRHHASGPRQACRREQDHPTERVRVQECN